MIHGKTSRPDYYGTLETSVQEVLDYLENNDLTALENGSHVIDGNRLFVNIVSYPTTSPENRFWEAHKDYLDVHVPIEGTEQIDLNFLEDLEVGEYKKEEDFQAAFGPARMHAILKPGDFLVCYPQDAHRTAIAVDGKPEQIRKAIFKVRIG